MAISDALRERVAVRAKYCCEYCLSQQFLSHDDFAIDHIFPQALGGGDEPENLGSCCQGCNSRKQDRTMALDPLTGELVPLYHPRRDIWRLHFAWSADYSRIEGLTQTGRATVSLLNLNRPFLIGLRQALHQVGQHPPA